MKGEAASSVPFLLHRAWSGVLQNFPVGAKLGNISDSLCSFIVDVWDLGLGWFILDISPGENVLEKGCTRQGRVCPAPTPLTLATFNPGYFWGFHLMKMHKGHLWRGQTEYLAIHSLVPAYQGGIFLFFVIFLCFNDNLALCGTELLAFWRQNVVHWTWGFGKRFVQNCWEVWGLHPTVQLLFHSHSLRGAEHAGSVPLSCSDGSFLLAIRGPGAVWVSVHSCASQLRCFLLTSLSFGECALLNCILEATGGYFDQTCSSLHSSKFRINASCTWYW